MLYFYLYNIFAYFGADISSDNGNKTVLREILSVLPKCDLHMFHQAILQFSYIMKKM